MESTSINLNGIINESQYWLYYDQIKKCASIFQQAMRAKSDLNENATQTLLMEVSDCGNVAIHQSKWLWHIVLENYAQPVDYLLAGEGSGSSDNLMADIRNARDTLKSLAGLAEKQPLNQLLVISCQIKSKLPT